MIVEHGAWEDYKPVSPKPFPGRIEGAFGPTLLYSRRIDTGEDWYEYRKQFNGDTVLMTLWPSSLDGTLIVQAVTRDVQMLFPSGGRLIELHGYTGDDPFAEFNGKIYDGGFTERRLPPPRNLLQEVTDLTERIERLEQLLTKRGLLDE